MGIVKNTPKIYALNDFHIIQICHSFSAYILGVFLTIPISVYYFQIKQCFDFIENHLELLSLILIKDFVLLFRYY